MLIKIFALGPAVYFNDSWNKFDCAIVISSLLYSFGSWLIETMFFYIDFAPKLIRALRVLRILRILRLVKNFPGI